MFEHLVTELSLTTAYGSLSCLVAVKTVRGSKQGLQMIKSVSLVTSPGSNSRAMGSQWLLGKTVSLLLVCGSWWVNHTPLYCGIFM